MFSLILYNKCSHFFELILKPLQFQAKRREVQVADVSLSEADPLQFLGVQWTTRKVLDCGFY